jgi:hypothetical protein
MELVTLVLLPRQCSSDEAMVEAGRDGVVERPPLEVPLPAHIGILLLATSLGSALPIVASGAADSSQRLVDVAAVAGLSFVSRTGDGAMDYIVEANGNGGAWLDYDGDGDLDILLISGGTLDEAAAPGQLLALYDNDGSGRFTEMTKRSGLMASGWGMGVCTGDIDADGAVDFYVTAWGPNRLFRNRGDGTFEEIAAAAGVDDRLWGHSCAFGDLDSDGHADLYVTNYVHFDPSSVAPRGPDTPCGYRGSRAFCGPLGLEAQPDRIFLNRGDGTFVAAGGSIPQPVAPRYAMGVIIADLDLDGWLDIFVGNDSQMNYLFRNTGGGQFEEIAMLAGVATDERGNRQATMGIAAGDYDRDGDSDLFVTNFSQDHNTLYRNHGSYFVDATLPSRLGHVSTDLLGWGTLFLDLDHDGWLDLVVSNGHVFDDVESFGIGSTFQQPVQVFRNLGDGRFADASADFGPDVLVARSGRGLAAGDLEGDGDLDLLIVQLNAPPALLRNDGGSRGAWLIVAPGPDGVTTGLRAIVETGEVRHFAQLVAGVGYLSASAPFLHFGLGTVERVDAVDVQEPRGRRIRYRDVPARRVLVTHLHEP